MIDDANRYPALAAAAVLAAASLWISPAAAQQAPVAERAPGPLERMVLDMLDDADQQRAAPEAAEPRPAGPIERFVRAMLDPAPDAPIFQGGDRPR